MADERAKSGIKPGHPATEDKIQTPGRKANAARPLNASDDAQGSKASRPASETRGSDAKGALAQNSGTSSGGDAG